MQFGKLYPRMYLGVTAGLVDGRHHRRLGAAWMLFCWCCMRQTGQGEEGIVCRGAIITYAEIAEEMNCSAANVRNWMRRLIQQGYVRVERDRRGIRVFIKNPKKCRLSKPAHSKYSETVQVDCLRLSKLALPKPIHASENAATSETLLQNDPTKLLKNNNTTSDAQFASDGISSLKVLAKKKSIMEQMSQAELEERQRLLYSQGQEMIKRFAANRST